MSCDLVCIYLTCWNWFNHHLDSSPSPWSPFLLKNALLSSCSSKRAIHCQIIAKTGVGMGTVNRISKEVDLEKENNPGGCPSKLSAQDKQSMICQITSGKLDNAVQATQFISNIISNPVTLQMHWKRVDYTLQQRRKYQCLRRLIVRGDFSSVCIMRTGLQRTGRGCSGQMRQRIGSDGKVYVWKQHGESISDHTTTPTVKVFTLPHTFRSDFYLAGTPAIFQIRVWSSLIGLWGQSY